MCVSLYDFLDLGDLDLRMRMNSQALQHLFYLCCLFSSTMLLSTVPGKPNTRDGRLAPF